jgi:hypothetical protein
VHRKFRLNYGSEVSERFQRYTEQAICTCNITMKHVHGTIVAVETAIF